MCRVVYRRSPPPSQRARPAADPREPTSPSASPSGSPYELPPTWPAGCNDDYDDDHYCLPDNPYPVPDGLVAFNYALRHGDHVPTDYSNPAGHRRQTNEYANSAFGPLQQSTQDQEVEYELVAAITSCGILDARGLCSHVNFTARSTETNSKEEFFFAELYWDLDNETMLPISIVALEEEDRVDGSRGTESTDYWDGMNVRMDPHHCYACGEGLKHPVDVTLYEIGHKAMSDCYGLDD